MTAGNDTTFRIVARRRPLTEETGRTSLFDEWASVRDESSTGGSLDFWQVGSARQPRAVEEENHGYPTIGNHLLHGNTQLANHRLHFSFSPVNIAIDARHNRITPFTNIKVTTDYSNSGVIGEFRIDRRVERHEDAFDLLRIAQLRIDDALISDSSSDYGLSEYPRQATRNAIHEAIVHASNDANEQGFELGMESEFSRALHEAFRADGGHAFGEVRELLNKGDISDDVANESLIQLGLIRNAETHIQRLNLLMGYLTNENPCLRQGALLGIASMDDPEAVTALEKAHEAESVPMLKLLASQVLERAHSIVADGNAVSRSQ